MKSEKNELLIKAIKEGNIEAAKAAIEGGGDVNWIDENGASPLIILAQTSANKEIGKMLLVAGANIEQENKRGETAIYLAPRDSDLSKLLQKNHQLLKAARTKEFSEVAEKILHDPDIFINVRGKKGCTALLFACFHNLEENVKILLEKGADIAAESWVGNDAIEIAISKLNFGLALFLIKKQGLEIETISTSYLEKIACFYFTNPALPGLERLVATIFKAEAKEDQIKLKAACNLLELFYCRQKKTIPINLNIFAILHRFAGEIPFDSCHRNMVQILERLAFRENITLENGHTLEVIKAGIKGHASFFIIKLGPLQNPLEISYLDGNCPFDRGAPSSQKRVAATFTFPFNENSRDLAQIKMQLAQQSNLKDLLNCLVKMTDRTFSKSCFITPQKTGNCVGASSKIALEQIEIEQEKARLAAELSPAKQEEIHQLRKAFFNRLIEHFVEIIDRGAESGDARAIEVIAKARIHAQRKLENADEKELQSRELARNILAKTKENYLSPQPSATDSSRLDLSGQQTVDLG
jgi:hypothetical protein